MSRTTLDPADTVVPELDAAIAEVDRTFKLLRAAQTKLARSSRPDSLEVARLRVRDAEAAYRGASDHRDELVQVRNARLTQRGDKRGALWSRPDGVDGPVISAADRKRREDGAELGRSIVVKMRRAGGYDPKLGPKHPNNQDPTLEQSPAKRTTNAVWLRMQIESLANDADGNAREDAANAEESGNDERDKYEARAETAKHYAKELRRILRGLTWDEDFADRVHKADQKTARRR